MFKDITYIYYYMNYNNLKLNDNINLFLEKDFEIKLNNILEYMDTEEFLLSMDCNHGLKELINYVNNVENYINEKYINYDIEIFTKLRRKFYNIELRKRINNLTTDNKIKFLFMNGDIYECDMDNDIINMYDIKHIIEDIITNNIKRINLNEVKISLLDENRLLNFASYIELKDDKYITVILENVIK